MFPVAASHNKAGVTVNPTEADKNQQNTLPHLRLMEWVWSYFVVTNLYEGTSESSEDDQSTKAGAVHAQPSKQTRGASHWQHQEERSSKHQKTGNQQTNGKSGADYEASGSNSSAAVTRSGGSAWMILTEPADQHVVRMPQAVVHDVAACYVHSKHAACLLSTGPIGVSDDGQVSMLAGRFVTWSLFGSSHSCSDVLCLCTPGSSICVGKAHTTQYALVTAQLRNATVLQRRESSYTESCMLLPPGLLATMQGLQTFACGGKQDLRGKTKLPAALVGVIVGQGYEWCCAALTAAYAPCRQAATVLSA